MVRRADRRRLYGNVLHSAFESLRHGFLDKTTYARSAILDFGSQQSAVIVY